MSRRVLIVEDSPTQAEALFALLVGAGYEVDVARTGEEGLAVVRSHSHDVVISDVVMPGALDGYELCRRIKATPHRETPVMLLTSLSDPMDIIRGLECGADNFLTKPYNPEHLLDRLKTLLATRATRGSAKLRMGVKVFFMGREFTISSEREQILDLLISTFEDAVRQNRELQHREEELRAAKEELARYAGSLEQRLQSVLASVPDVLFSLNPALTELYYISPASTAVLGYRPEELTADPGLWLRAAAAPDQPGPVSELTEIARSGRPATREYRLRQADGSVRWIRESVVPIADPIGRVVRVDGIARDITGERRLEEQVRVAQKIEAVGTLAGGVAHDFNNLLAVIKSSVDLVLAESGLSDQVRDDLREVDQAAERATVLTRQLLAFGRKQVLEPRALDLNSLVSGTVKMLQRIIGADIRLVVGEVADVTTVHADPGQLEQVLMNLCVNARDAMPSGGELAIATDRVTLDEEFCLAHAWARPGDYVRLTVSDTGTGMDAATLTRIFEPFFTTKEMGRGTGLGLAVVYGIVKQHGGLLHVYSEVGIGTAFRIYFPFHEAAPEARASGPAFEVAGGTETLLLAEDDPTLRVMATRILERLGYRVIAVPNGAEALRAMQQGGNDIRLAILDVIMPGIGGREVFEAMRKIRPDLRVIFSTGYNPGTSQLEPIRALPADTLVKPYGLQTLARAVRTALDRPGGP
jgi:two-component system cell cycle sensor histidine kinase/response regulator CckA